MGWGHSGLGPRMTGPSRHMPSSRGIVGIGDMGQGYLPELGPAADHRARTGCERALEPCPVAALQAM